MSGTLIPRGAYYSAGPTLVDMGLIANGGGHSWTTGATATTGGQAGALRLRAQWNFIDGVQGAGSGVQLPNLTGGQLIYIFNRSASNITVWTAVNTNDVIVGVGTSEMLSSGSTRTYVSVADGWIEWIATGGTSGPFLPLSGGILSTSASLPNQVIFNLPAPSAANVPQGSMLNSYLVSQTTGGSFFDMYCNIRADTTIQGSGSTGITGVLSQMTYNGNGGSGGYVPLYGQMSRRTVNAGGTAQNPQIWGAVLEVIDWTNTDSAQTNHMSGLEIDMTCGNTDSANNRRALGIYLNYPTPATDTPPVCNMGIHVAANVGSYNTTLKVEAPFNQAAIDLRLASAVTSAAHQIWLGNSGTIAMDTPASVTLSGDTTGGITVAGTASHPARFIYQANGGTGEKWWAGAWTDGSFYIADYTTSTNRLIISSAGALTVNATSLGFFNSTPVAKPTVTGAKGGNAALGSLLSALASLGLITDSTSA